MWLLTTLFTLPLFYVFTYTYTLDLFTNNEEKLMVGSIILIMVSGLSGIYIIYKRQAYRADIRVSYRKEYAYTLVISAFGWLGFVVMFVEFGGDTRYVIHLLMGLFIVHYITLVWLGKHVFNIRLLGLKD